MDELEEFKHIVDDAAFEAAFDRKLEEIFEEEEQNE